jgi:hypothetical protein
MKPPVPRLDVSREELRSLLEHVRTGLSESEYQQLQAALDTLVYLTLLMEDKSTTIARLRQILFGATTEKTSNVVQKPAANGATSAMPEGGNAGTEPASPPFRDMGAMARRTTAVPTRSRLNTVSCSRGIAARDARRASCTRWRRREC